MPGCHVFDILQLSIIAVEPMPLRKLLLDTAGATGMVRTFNIRVMPHIGSQ